MDDLKRFIEAQNHKDTYKLAIEEIRNKYKQHHWMWYIFPQIKGLGHSPFAVYYGLDGLEEAEAYLKHETLASRLYEACNEVLKLNKEEIFSLFNDLDYLKLCSSMTLFAKIKGKDSIFQQIIDKFYDGKEDKRTLTLLEETNSIW